MRSPTRLLQSIGGVGFIVSLSSATAFAHHDARVTLNVLNPAHGAAEIVVARGEPIEVAFDVHDPHGVTCAADWIEAVRVDNGHRVSKAYRGAALSGTVELETRWRGAVGLLAIRYVMKHRRRVLDEAPQQVWVVEDPLTVEILERLAAL
jgi:hypothetical protein